MTVVTEALLVLVALPVVLFIGMLAWLTDWSPVTRLIARCRGCGRGGRRAMIRLWLARFTVWLSEQCDRAEWYSLGRWAAGSQPLWRSALARYRDLRTPPPLDLAAPPLMAEVHIHVAGDGTWRLYAPHVEGERPVKMIVEALVGAGVEYARRHGLSVGLAQPPGGA